MIYLFNFYYRNEGFEKVGFIYIGSNIWFGGYVVVLLGVMIGEGSVIGVGSVVIKDILLYSLVVGNFCKVVCKIDNDLLFEILNDEMIK